MASDVDRIWGALEGRRIASSGDAADKLTTLFPGDAAGVDEYFVASNARDQIETWSVSHERNAAGYYLMWRQRVAGTSPAIPNDRYVAHKDREALVRTVRRMCLRARAARYKMPWAQTHGNWTSVGIAPLAVRSTRGGEWTNILHTELSPEEKAFVEGLT